MNNSLFASSRRMGVLVSFVALLALHDHYALTMENDAYDTCSLFNELNTPDVPLSILNKQNPKEITTYAKSIEAPQVPTASRSNVGDTDIIKGLSTIEYNQDKVQHTLLQTAQQNPALTGMIVVGTIVIIVGVYHFFKK